MKRRTLYFWVAVALQVMVLVGMTGIRAYTLATGTRILLKTLPVDPRDLFRGDYVRLRYEISELHAGQIRLEDHEYRRGDVIWVVLEPGSPYWHAVAAGHTRPRPASGQVVAQGRVRYAYNWTPPSENPDDPQHPDKDRTPAPTDLRLEVEYGIESFFVPEGQGRPLERPEIRLDVEVAVDRFGHAAIARVFADGQEVNFE